MCAYPDNTWRDAILPKLTILEEEVDAPLGPVHPAVALTQTPFPNVVFKMAEDVVESVQLVAVARRHPAGSPSTPPGVLRLGGSCPRDRLQPLREDLVEEFCETHPGLRLAAIGSRVGATQGHHNRRLVGDKVPGDGLGRPWSHESAGA
jgi:hypothetical protein